MTEPVVIVLLGKPVPGTKARGKFRWIPKNQTHAMDQLKLAASEVMLGRPMLEGPLRLSLIAEMPIPKTFSKKRKAEAILGAVLPTVAPDLKNIVWLAEDAMTSVVYADDKLICRHITEKRYSEKPKLSIVVECIDTTDVLLRACEPKPMPLLLVVDKK